MYALVVTFVQIAVAEALFTCKSITVMVVMLSLNQHLHLEKELQDDNNFYYVT